MRASAAIPEIGIRLIHALYCLLSSAHNVAAAPAPSTPRASMKISKIKVIVTCPGRNFTVVKIETDEGVYGVGEGTLNGSELAVATALKHASEILIGLDPHRIEDIWHLMYHHAYWRRGPIQMAAISAIDMALWDIKGKVAKLPVYQLLGGKAREGCLVYGHASGATHEQLVDSVRGFQHRGYKVIRVQHGGYGGPGAARTLPPHRPGIPGFKIFEPVPYLLDTPRMFAHLRAELGDEVELCHDVHEQLTPQQAADLARNLQDFRLFFLEDPVRPDHKDSFKLVREASTTPLAMGELFVSRWDCLPLFVNQWIDYIRIKPQHVGGITEAKKIFTLAEPYQVKSASHGARDIGPIGQAASIHVNLTIPNFGVQEWSEFGQQEKEVFGDGCFYHDGYAFPQEKPGLGIDINEAAAARFPYRKAYMPLVRREDGTMHVY